MTRPELLAVFDETGQPQVLARRNLYIPAPSRDGSTSARTHAGTVFLHEPTIAVLLPSELPLLTQRRPEFDSLRHVLARFSFMLGHLPPRHSYTAATLSIRLDHPDAAVRLQRPTWEASTGAETTDTVTTQYSAAVDAIAKLGAQRTRVVGTTRHSAQLPVVTAEKRSGRDFGWRYEAREGSPLAPRIEYAVAWIELPRGVTEISGELSVEATVEALRFGFLRKLRAVPGVLPLPFRCPLGTPE